MSPPTRIGFLSSYYLFKGGEPTLTLFVDSRGGGYFLVFSGNTCEHKSFFRGIVLEKVHIVDFLTFVWNYNLGALSLRNNWLDLEKVGY